MKFKKFSVTLIAMSLLAFQFATISGASAAEDTDIRLTAIRNFENQMIEFELCNDGSTSVKQIVLELEATNITYNEAFISPFDETPATDPGTFDLNTLTWEGILASGECQSIGLFGADSGVLGDSVTTTLRIVSAIQVDDTVNTDTNPGNDEVVLPSFTISPLSDLQVDSRLATTGTITESTEVSYQIDFRNIGEGEFTNPNNYFIFAFILPPDSTFLNVVDENVDDALVVDPGNCFAPGTVGEVGIGAGLAPYADRTIVVCNLSIGGEGVLPVGNTIYPFSVNITAGASLAAGTADVVGIVQGNDVDTLELARTLVSGGDPLDLGSNNVVYLSYDPEALTATASLCPGQGPTTTNGTGCFRITFNKRIYAPSFTTDDFDLGGVGNVSGFEQLDDFTWEVRVSGILPGQTLTLNLRLNEIQDYSAQQNGTQVLGINTIRFAETQNVDETNNEGQGSQTLPQTGTSTSGLLVSFVLLLIGFVLQVTSRKRVI